MCSRRVGGYQGLLVYSVCGREQLTSDGSPSAHTLSNLKILCHTSTTCSIATSVILSLLRPPPPPQG